ncbi:patatin family protein [Bacillus sp. 165]|uniref:patatin-like phospholipase family protein n=1 Tax=Bacillus sp. 165 TaxID=1529117 RepID=UPI001AD9C260|nr:patatin family protein [Bacillus sp. 165]MBO9128832.1 patatin family protein [Bacillus sp. 165]
MLEKTGLVLEGGGMRGVYTAGVLEFFMEKHLFFPYIIGVSAGACNAASYLSRQKERNKQVNIGYINHPNYLSYKNLWRKKQLFDMDFIFNEIPTQHVPFDFDTFYNSAERFVVGTTDIETGEPMYFEKAGSQQDMLTVLRASSSLPFIAPIVKHENKQLLDGGIVDPIPIRKAQSDGFEKNVLILTRNKGYTKKKSSTGWLVERAFSSYPQLVNKMKKRYFLYNETLKYIEEQEREGSLFIIRPVEKLEVGRLEKNQQKLTALYNQGYMDAERLYEDLQHFLEKK